jgi:hypothetical protein
LLLMLGHQSEREVIRNRLRTTAAMAAQGRHLGGRPPYVYRLVDAGPHPKAMHAGWGRRQHRLDVDPVTALIVGWMFACRLDGMSTAGIARLLNERGIPSPGVYDHQRNRHRRTAVWTLRTVAAILANPRYTGRQVWNRQYTDHREAVPGDKRSCSPTTQPRRRHWPGSRSQEGGRSWQRREANRPQSAPAEFADDSRRPTRT